MADHFSARRIHTAATLALAILPGVHVLTLHGIISDAVQLGKPQILLIYYSSFIGMAFSMAFFAPLWSRLPITTEGEFLLWRFNGPWAGRLHVMRSLLLGLLVIPILMCLLLMPLQQVLTEALGLDHSTALLALAGLLLLGAAINSFSQRIRIDRVIGMVAAALTLPLLFLAIAGRRTQQTLAPIADWHRWLDDLNTIDVLTPILVLWWFAHIIDLPTMTGQKLLASRTARAGTMGAMIASAAMVLIGGVFLALPLAIGYTPEQGSFFAYVGIALRSGPWLSVLVAFYLCTGLFLLLNLQHWAGALIDGNLIKHHVPGLHARRTAVPVMLLTSALGFLWLFVHDRTMETFWDRILITAGVGPVFILRWYLPRITALVQFTAMIGAIVYALLWHHVIATESGSLMAGWCTSALGLPQHLLQVGAIGLATLLTAAVPFALANPEEVAHGRARLLELHGGRPRLLSKLLLALGLCALYLLLATLPMMIGSMW
jgi:hypothetical protein